MADLSGVQHGFWVVLGTLSVLRTNAASTESTALRALGGTVVGFAAGALLLLGIGTSTPALWAALPIAVAVAAYAPGTLPFAFGQAAFTVVVVVLFNLLVPAGWRVGLLRIEDVAIGCLVSLVVGVLFWPRGASSVVGDDLADAFRRGAAYLTQAVDWALGTRADPPDAGAAAVTAGIRLDEALRGFLAEQGTKRVIQGRPVDAGDGVHAAPADRLLAGRTAGPREHAAPQGSGHGLRAHHAGARHRGPDGLLRAGRGAGGAAGRRPGAAAGHRPGVHRPGRATAARRAGPEDTGVEVLTRAGDADGLEEGDGTDLVRVITAPHHPHLLWVAEHLQHLSSHAQAIADPASHVAEQRRLPWWR